jgi:hypothetical protein
VTPKEKPVGKLAWIALVFLVGASVFLRLYHTERSAFLSRQWEPLCEGKFADFSVIEESHSRGGGPTFRMVKVRYTTIHFVGGAQVHGIVGVFPRPEVGDEIVVMKNGLNQYRFYVRQQK